MAIITCDCKSKRLKCEWKCIKWLRTVEGIHKTDKNRSEIIKSIIKLKSVFYRIKIWWLDISGMMMIETEEEGTDKVS